MQLTPFANTALVLLAGMLLSLFVGLLGRGAYMGVIALLVALVLWSQWQSGSSG